jgi:hypothetical protein
VPDFHENGPCWLSLERHAGFDVDIRARLAAVVELVLGFVRLAQVWMQPNKYRRV